MTKVVKPVNPLIYRTALQFAAVFYEAGRSTGMTSKHKNARSYAKANLERFIPKVIESFLDMLKPTSNCNEHMRDEIYHALIDPTNDPDLMEGKVNGLPNVSGDMVAKAIKAFDKNKIITPITSTGTVLDNPIAKKPNLKGTTVLNKGA